MVHGSWFMVHGSWFMDEGFTSSLIFDIAATFFSYTLLLFSYEL
jgi:hypothetical protein